MKSVCILGSIGLAQAVYDDGLPRGIEFNMTEAEEAESQAAFDRNMEEYEQSNYVSTVEVSRGMTRCDQKCSQWCWATSATMTSSAFTSISSGECVTYEARAASMKTGANCDSRCSSQCDRPGQGSDITSAIRQFSGASYTVGNSLSQSQLDNALQKGPVVILVRWNGGGGHAITCSGVSSGKYQIHDPEGQDKSLSYNQVMHYQNGQGTWSQTVYSQGGAPGPAPSPHPGPSPSPGPKPYYSYYYYAGQRYHNDYPDRRMGMGNRRSDGGKMGMGRKMGRGVVV